MRQLNKFTAVLLSLALIFSVAPIVSAQTVIDADNTNIVTDETISQPVSEPYIIGELTEKRTANTKHFLMSDRSVMAAMYEEVVHYYDDGAWVDVDNSLSTNDENEFENKSNSFKTKFSKKSNGNKLVTIKKDNYSLSWMLDNADKVNAEISQSSESENEDKSALKNLTGSVTYPEIQNNVDLQYVVSGEDIKENIILKNADTPTEYSFSYKFNKLKYRTNEDNQIEFYDESNPENIVFIIDTPYMYDSANVYSRDIEMQIAETNNGFTLTLVPDKEWLLSEERAYPIVIDPPILNEKDARNIWDITLKKGQTTDLGYTTKELLVGSDASGNVYRTLMKFVELPEIDTGGIIIDAKMELTAYLGAYAEAVPTQITRPTQDIQVNIHRVNASWPQQGAIWSTYANSYNSKIENYFIYNDTDDGFAVDITNLVSDWYKNPLSNYGMMIKSSDESVGDHLMQFTASDWGDPQNEAHMSWRPILLINYRNCVGLEDYWSYTTQDMGGYGTGYINNYNGNLTYIHNDINFNSGITGFTLSHIYNSTNSVDDTGYYGKGWSLNLVQKLEPITIETNATVKFVYTDSDGTKHYFVQPEGSSSIVDEDGLGYTLTEINETVDSGTTSLTHQITTKDDIILKFDIWGFLRRIIDTNGNTISLHYRPGETMSQNYIGAISTSSGGYITFEYQNNELTSITDNANRVTTFSYTSGNLTKITYPDGNDLDFEYSSGVSGVVDSTSWLKNVILPNEFKYCYENYDNGKIKTATTKTSTAVQGNELYFTYNNNQTTVKDSSDRTATYQFDSFGRVTCAYDSKGNSYSNSYTQNSETTDGIFANNKLSMVSNNIKYINNFLSNSAFLNDLTSWTKYTEAPNETQISVVSDQKYISSKCVKITSTANSVQALIQCPATSVGKTYTLSANIKTENIISDSSRGAGVEIVTSSPTGNKYYYSDFITGTTDSEINDGFVTASVTAALASDESIIRISVGLYNASGTVWIDSIQLEDGDTANKINLVENSSFEKGTAGFTPSSSNSNSGSTNSEARSNSYSLKMSGLSLQNYNYKQDIAISGSAGYVYSFGAWTKGYSLPYGDDLGRYKMVCEFTHSDGETSRETIPFNTLVNEWQYGAKNIIAEKDYTKITLYLCYNKNCNYALFDSLFLYRDTAQSYTYDNEGNVISTADYASQQSNYEYGDSSSLSRILSPDGTSYEYGYDSKNNLVTSRSNVGVQYNIAYDENGNPTSTSVSADNYSTTIQSGKSYYIRLKGTGKYLTVDGDNACQASFTGGDNQKWLVEKANKGGYYLYPQSATDKGLNVANNTQDGNVTVATHSTSDTQRFDIELQSDYTYRIIAKCSTDSKLITVPYAATQNNVAVWTPQGELNANQAWYFEDVSIAPTSQIEDGAVYQLRARHSGRYVSVSNEETANGTLLVQYAQGCLDGQKFIISKYDSEYYTLSPFNAPDKHVNVTSTITSYDCKYIEISDAQIADTSLFKFTYDSQKGAYKICPKSNPDAECFAVAFSDCSDSASVVSAGVNDSDNRYFVLEKISESITSSATYQNNGNYPYTVTDSRGNTTTYTYDTSRGIQTGVTDAKGNSTTYSYNSLNDRLSSVTSGSSAVSYTYETDGSLNSITSPSGTVYNFTYDKFGNTTQISVGSKALTQNTYDTTRGLLTESVYGNGQKIGYKYDILDRVTQKLYNNIIRVKYRYDKFGNLYEKQDLFTNVTYRYSYDLIGRIAGVGGSNGTSLNYVYDEFNRTQKYIAKFGDNTNVTEYIYGDNAVSGQHSGLIYGVKQNGAQRISYAYDQLARLDTRTLGTTTPFVTKYSYLQGATSGTTTTLVKTVQNGSDVYEYSYDKVGNITQIKKNGSVYESYSYDSLNQLRAVVRGSDTYVYNYDNGGNIKTVTKNGETIKTYGYTDSNWRDKLTSYNGSAITYDAIGNPLTYRDGYNFTWANGRQLTAITNGTNFVNYLYNADGLRAKKSVNGTVTDYYWLEGILLGQKTGDDYITYLYDENGAAYGIICNDTYYYYVFNAQGDVVGIIDQNGTQVVQYDYSAWGEVLSITGTLADTLGQTNPIRYRGYYYDAETGFYYLQSRYYDPVTQRFLNADGLVSTGQDITGYNMFAYCGNNPVNRKDPTGQFWITALIVTAVAVVCTVALSGCSAQPTSDVGAAKPYVDIPGSDDPTSPNCYAYAISSPVNEQPGGTSGRIPTKWNDVNDVGKSVEADLKAKGYTVREISGPDTKVYDNEFKIALRVGTQPYAYNQYTGQLYYDYHFMRQTNTGQWAEKHGYGGPSVLWDAGMTPDTIPWTLGGVPYYDSAIIYYAVGN